MGLLFGASVILKANHGYLQLRTLTTAILKSLYQLSLSIWVSMAEALVVLTLLLLCTQKKCLCPSSAKIRNT